jgi:hypothetical protein
MREKKSETLLVMWLLLLLLLQAVTLSMIGGNLCAHRVFRGLCHD